MATIASAPVRDRRSSEPLTTVRTVVTVGVFAVLFAVLTTAWDLLRGEDLGDVVAGNAVQGALSGVLWAAVMWFTVGRPTTRAGEPSRHP